MPRLEENPLWLQKPYNPSKEMIGLTTNPVPVKGVKVKHSKVVKLKEGETLTPSGYIQKSLF